MTLLKTARSELSVVKQSTDCFSLRSSAVRSLSTSLSALRNSSLVLHNWTTVNNSRHSLNEGITNPTTTTNKKLRYREVVCYGRLLVEFYLLIEGCLTNAATGGDPLRISG